MGSPFLVFLITMAFIRFQSIRKYLTTTNLVYLYVTSLAVAYFANTSFPWGYVAGLKFTRLFSSESDVRYIPEFVAPPKDVAELLYRGGLSVGAIPWIILLPNIIWFFLIVALFGCISVGFVSIFRRQWIDIEMIPFPHVLLAHTCLVNVENSVKPKWPSKMPLLLGMLFGFLVEIAVSAPTLFPWFPDILMWRTNTCGNGAHWIAPPDIPWHLGITKNPPVYALLLLAPVHFLFSTVFYLLILEMALFIAYYGFGYYTGMLQMGYCGRNWCTPTPYTDPPLYFGVISVGCILGFFVIEIIRLRRYILETLKVAFRSGKSNEMKEDPMSYRTAWIIFIASFITMIIFFTYTGLNPWLSFAITLCGIISWFVATHTWGRAGVDWELCYNFTPGFVRLLAFPTLGGYPSITSTDLALGPVITTMWVGHQSIGGWGGSFYTVIASYKLAKLTGVNTKNVLKVMTVALFTSMFTTHFIEIILLGAIGGSKFTFPVIKATAINSDRWWNFWAKPAAGPSMAEVIPWLSIGFAFMVVMRFLYSKILWLPDPLAAILAWSPYAINLYGIWFAFLTAWIIKSIVLKIGGSRLYEEQVIPFVGGFILGTTLEIFIAALTSYALFPPPI
jgi:hypothetical protein